MDIENAKAVVKQLLSKHYELCASAQTAQRYYRNKTDILFNGAAAEGAMHRADNRIPSSFYSLLVNQKAGYMFSTPPTFDTGNSDTNNAVIAFLGDGFAKKCKDLCIKASNQGVAWLHYYEHKGELRYAVLDGFSVLPIYSDGLEKELIGVLRVYESIDDDGKCTRVYQLWNDKECACYSCLADRDIDSGFAEYNIFKLNYDGEEVFTNVYEHNFGCVPFIAFYNNDIGMNDLQSVKGLIDTYDKTYSGFANDLEDVQEVIMVLTGYEGEDIGEFMNELKRYKTIKLSAEDGSALQTLTIEIPVEARSKLLSMTRKAIFEQGQGVDPEPSSFGNTSGVALKYLYSLLELKAGLAETEFRPAFAALVKAFCRYSNLKCDKLIQTWTRTCIRNESEQADIAAKSKGIIPDAVIERKHPWTTAL